MKKRRLVGEHRSIAGNFDHEESPMKRVAATILEGGGKYVEQSRFRAVQIIEHRPTAKMVFGADHRFGPHGFE